MTSYRVGNHQPQNLYRDNDYIGVMFTPEDAALVVEALNAHAATTAAIESWLAPRRPAEAPATIRKLHRDAPSGPLSSAQTASGAPVGGSGRPEAPEAAQAVRVFVQLTGDRAPMPWARVIEVDGPEQTISDTYGRAMRIRLTSQPERKAVDDLTTLAGLVRHAGEHTEDCR